MAAHRVTLVPGDGVGPDVTAAARAVVDATGVAVEWDVREAAEAVESIRDRGVALKGPTTTRVEGGRSLNLALRAALDLHTSIRPVRSADGRIDLVVARMNGGDLYAGVEWEPGGEGAREVRRLARETLGAELPEDAGLSLKPLSATEARRVARAAIEWACERGRRHVTVAHKATVMRQTDGIFLAVALEELERAGLDHDDVLVDTLCGNLARHPERYDVLLMPTMYGDLVSDLAAGLAGGPGLAPNANVGDGCVVFETVHGTVPRLAGRGRANPMAAILAGAMMMQHLGEGPAADAVEGAVWDVVREGRTVTYDLTAARDEESAASTDEVAAAVAERVAAG
jgi:isocitrate dehydrogenase (NAD+)